MFDDERLPNIGIRVVLPGREESTQLDLDINPAGEINLNQLVSIIRETFQLDSNLTFFYLDHSYAAFELINPELLTSVHFTTLISHSNSHSTQTSSPSSASPGSPTNSWPTPLATTKRPAPNAAGSGPSRRPSS
jgi:hypothetical protein